MESVTTAVGPAQAADTRINKKIGSALLRIFPSFRFH
jgi:hypothetical protein